MGKVKKLRKKYNALCAKSKTSSDSLPLSLNLESQNVTSTAENSFGIESASHPMEDLDARSTYSISKSIKSSLSGVSIQKKVKQRLRHELFLKKLEASKEVFKKPKKKSEKKLDLKDDLPLLRTPVHTERNTKSTIPKHLKTEMKKRNPQKGLTKRRNAQLIQDVNMFRKMLSDNSFSKSVHASDTSRETGK